MIKAAFEEFDIWHPERIGEMWLQVCQTTTALLGLNHFISMDLVCQEPSWRRSSSSAVCLLPKKLRESSVGLHHSPSHSQSSNQSCLLELWMGWVGRVLAEHPLPHSLDIEVHASNVSIREQEQATQEFWGQPVLHGTLFSCFPKQEKMTS